MKTNLSARRKVAGATIRRRRPGKTAGKRSGQVVVIVLLGMTLLVGLI
ncbi:MAG: hypothetical protein HZA50_06600, partial [Planctomycetes bacterium]|nr:hypothetical protein [Planctomycetota bacterium]